MVWYAGRAIFQFFSQEIFMSISHHAHRKTFLAVQTALAALVLSLPMTAVGAEITVQSKDSPDRSPNSTGGDTLGAGSSVDNTLVPFSGFTPIASGNTVTIDGWNDAGSPAQTADHYNVAGGVSAGGDVSSNDNTVILKNASGIGGRVVGGVTVTSGSGTTRGNVVRVEAQSAAGFSAASGAGDIIGGLTLGMDGTTLIAEENRVYLGGAVANSVYGSLARHLAGPTGAVVLRGNKVYLDSGAYVGGDAVGAWAENVSGFTGATLVEENRLEITDANITGNATGSYALFGGTATVRNNHVILTNSAVNGYVYGGRSQSNDGDVTGNSVTIVSGAFGGNITGGDIVSGVGNATGNIVTIQSGTFSGGHIIGGGVTTGVASGNILNVSGGNFAYDVIGGWVAGNGGSAIHNTVNISGSANLIASGLFGGRTSNSPADLFTGNTLNLKGWTGSVQNVGNFEYYNFYLPGTLANGGTVLTVTDSGAAIDLDNSRINVGIDGAHTALNAGDTVTLIDASATTSLSATGINSTTDSTTLSDGIIDIKGTLAADTTAKKLNFSVTSLAASAYTKTFSEGYAGGLIFVAQAGDLAARQGVSALRRIQGQNAPGGLSGFGALEWGSSRYETGSHVDVKGYHLLAGLGTNGQGSAGGYTLGAFFEGGDGDYDSKNSFANATVKGDGDVRYYGAGILGRFDFAGNFYLDGSLRAGRVENDFSAVINGKQSKYDSASQYASLHTGAGYLWQVSETNTLDFNAQFLWTRQDGDNVTLSTGHRVRFSAADSERLRLGAKFSTAVSARANFHVGAAWEREFDGKIKATVNGYAIAAPELKGNTGIAEIGFELRPAANHPLRLDIGFQGYRGQRDGTAGSVKLNYAF
jgi:outer membrane autotransporter protein